MDMSDNKDVTIYWFWSVGLMKFYAIYVYNGYLED